MWVRHRYAYCGRRATREALRKPPGPLHLIDALARLALPAGHGQPLFLFAQALLESRGHTGQRVLIVAAAGRGQRVGEDALRGGGGERRSEPGVQVRAAAALRVGRAAWRAHLGLLLEWRGEARCRCRAGLGDAAGAAAGPGLDGLFSSTATGGLVWVAGAQRLRRSEGERGGHACWLRIPADRYSSPVSDDSSAQLLSCAVPRCCVQAVGLPLRPQAQGIAGRSHDSLCS